MKKILIIAGSCSNGGAGLQADIKACSHFGCYSATAVTALTAENTDKIKNIKALEPSFINDQLEMLGAEFSFDAIKIGMLFNEEIMDVVENFIAKSSAKIVLDPVCVSKNGQKLIKDSAIERLKELMKYAHIATPNLREVNVLFGDKFDELPCDIVVKKQVINGLSIDTLRKKDGGIQNLQTPLANPLIITGAGCTFSSSIACLLAQNKNIQEAIQEAKEYIYKSISASIDTNLGKKRLLNHCVKED